MPTRTSGDSTDSLIRQLKRHPPTTEGELEARLSGAPVEPLRAKLVDELAKSKVKPGLELMLFAALRHIGVGDERARLEKLALDPSLGRTLRSRALRLLTEGQPGGMSRLFNQLPPADAFLPLEATIEDLLLQVANEPDAADELTRLLTSLPAEALPVLIQPLETMRLRLQLPAAALYATAVEHPALAPMHRTLMEAIVKEGGEPARALLNRLRDASTTPEQRRSYQRALLRAQTDAISEAQPAPRKGYAQVSACDGAGAFLVLGIIEAGKKTVMYGNVAIRASGEIRDGFVAGPTSEREIQKIVQNVPTEIAFRKLSLEAASALIALVREAAPTPARKLPKAAEVALTMLVQTPPAELPEVTPAVGVTKDRIVALLDEAMYDSWTFDPNDAPGLDEGRRAGSAKWRKKVATQLAAGPGRARLTSMTHYMTYWYAFGGEPELASVMAALEVQLKTDFAGSPLVQVLIDRIVAWEDTSDEPDSPIYGDVERRRALRRELFSSVEKATGRDLAHLDYVEAANAVLGGALARVPVDNRLNPIEAASLAEKVGTLFADIFTAGKLPSPQVLFERLAPLMDSLEPDRQVAAQACLPDLFMALIQFREQVCEACPVDCLHKPKANLTKAFFSDKHPIDQG